MLDKIKNYIAFFGNTTMIATIIFIVSALIGFPIITLFLWMFDTIVITVLKHPIIFMLYCILMIIVSITIAKKFVKAVNNGKGGKH